MRFHVVSLPHTRTSKEFCSCAYTQKVYNFCVMMKSLGHTVIHYGAEGSEAVCDEEVTLLSKKDQEILFDNKNWKQRNFQIDWDSNQGYWRLFNARSIEEINKRKQKKDFVCVISGSQHPLESIQDVLTVEFGIGYYGVFAKYKVFESYTHQSAVYARNNKDPNGSFYDAVIPNYFDVNDYEFSDQKDTYLLYLGRLIKRKGLAEVQAIASATGRPLILAGQGVVERSSKHIKTEEGMVIELSAKTKYFGFAGIKARSALLSHAHCVLMPTEYLEPFGGVAVEAQLCGTPVISTDYAAFTETIKHGISGYRCHTLEQFAWAVENCKKLNCAQIRELAIANYSIDRVKYMYQEYFNMLFDLWGHGWNTKKNRSQLDWLIKK